MKENKTDSTRLSVFNDGRWRRRLEIAFSVPLFQQVDAF